MAPKKPLTSQQHPTLSSTLTQHSHHRKSPTATSREGHDCSHTLFQSHGEIVVYPKQHCQLRWYSSILPSPISPRHTTTPLASVLRSFAEIHYRWWPSSLPDLSTIITCDYMFCTHFSIQFELSQFGFHLIIIPFHNSPARVNQCTRLACGSPGTKKPRIKLIGYHALVMVDSTRPQQHSRSFVRQVGESGRIQGHIGGSDLAFADFNNVPDQSVPTSRTVTNQ
jgi:hypothetical protein